MKIIKSLSSVIAVAATLAFSSSAFAVSGNWINTGATGNWNTATNWSSNPTVPGTTAGDTVNLNANFAAATAITLDTNAIVGTMVFGDSTATYYGLTLNGTNTLTFNNNGSNATLTFQGSTSAAETPLTRRYCWLII